MAGKMTKSKSKRKPIYGVLRSFAPVSLSEFGGEGKQPVATIDDMKRLFIIIHSETKVPVNHNLLGPVARCFANVQNCIKAKGGVLIMGWDKFKTPNGHIGYDVHCVWKDNDGNLWEVTEGITDAKFIIDPELPLWTIGEVFFESDKVMANKLAFAPHPSGGAMIEPTIKRMQ
jgi:hypothetical protein